MTESHFLVEGRGEQRLSAQEIKALHQRGQLNEQTRLSRDGKQWFAAIQLLNRLPEEKQKPPTPVLR